METTNLEHNHFLEYEGQLYLRRGSRGYGAMICDLESLKYVEEKDGKQYATVDFKLFDEFDHTETLEFSKVNDIWIMTDEVVPAINETIEIVVRKCRKKRLYRQRWKIIQVCMSTGREQLTYIIIWI